MKIIFAQGNPGTTYDGTRHNIGFALLDDYAAHHRAQFVEKTKFHAIIAPCTVAGEKILLVKPTTFYNETGQSLRALVDFYKLQPAHDVLVLHDDLALPFGTIRTRERGSDAGNNGVKSLNAHIGEHYKRVRIGISNDYAAHKDAAAFVLDRFSAAEQSEMSTLSRIVAQTIDEFINEQFVATSHASTKILP